MVDDQRAIPLNLLSRFNRLFTRISAVAWSLFGEGFEGLWSNSDFSFLVQLESGTCRHQVAQDYVFLETDQAVRLARQGGFGENLGRFLEACRRDEALGLHGRFGDS